MRSQTKYFEILGSLHLLVLFIPKFKHIYHKHCSFHFTNYLSNPTTSTHVFRVSTDTYFSVCFHVSTFPPLPSFESNTFHTIFKHNSYAFSHNVLSFTPDNDTNASDLLKLFAKTLISTLCNNNEINEAKAKGFTYEPIPTIHDLT